MLMRENQDFIYHWEEKSCQQLSTHVIGPVNIEVFAELL